MCCADDEVGAGGRWVGFKAWSRGIGRMREALDNHVA